MRERVQEAIDRLRHEYTLLNELELALENQREAVKKNNMDAIMEATDRVSTLIERLASAQVWRTTARSEFGDKRPTTFVEILGRLGIPASEELMTLAREVRDKHNVVVRNLAINRAVIQYALETNRITLQELGVALEQNPSYVQRSHDSATCGVMFDALA